MPPPKSDTNPLTRVVHMYYTHPRLARHTPQTQRRNTQPRGNHSPGPHEDSTSKPIPKGGPHAAPRLKQTRNVRLRRTAISSFLRPRLSLPPPTTKRWKVHRLCSAGPVLRRPADSTLPIIGCVYPGPLRAGFPGRSTDPRFSKALVSLFVPPSPPSVYPADAPGRRF